MVLAERAIDRFFKAVDNFSGRINPQETTELDLQRSLHAHVTTRRFRTFDVLITDGVGDQKYVWAHLSGQLNKGGKPVTGSVWGEDPEGELSPIEAENLLNHLQIFPLRPQ